MRNIFIVVRDVSGLETASDVNEFEDDEVESLEEFIGDVYTRTYLSFEVGGIKKIFNPQNLISIHLEEL